MAPILYMIPPSPPVRAVQITAKAIGLQLEEKNVDLFQGEQLTPEYLKLNPLHTVPTLVEEDGFVVYDSHAINTYLVSKYAKNDSLYPQDLKKRALVDQRLHFDTGVAFATLFQIVLPMHKGLKKSVDESDRESIDRVYGFLEAFLDGEEWMAGGSVTIADYNLYATVTGLDILAKLDVQKFPKVAAWVQRVDSRPEVQVSKKGLDDCVTLIKSRLS